MNRSRNIVITVLLSMATIACNPESSEPPQARLDLNKQYTATTISTGRIYMGVRGRWLPWDTDSASIKPLLSRITEAGKNPGFLPQNTSLAAGSGRVLRFSAADSLAYLAEADEEKGYRFGVPANYNLLMLISTDTLTILENQKPAAVDKIGYIKPLYYVQTTSPEEGFAYETRSLPERYFTLESGELQAPGINYYIMTKDSLEAYASINNYLNDQGLVLQSLAEGDTLLLQVFRTDYE